MLTTIIQQTIQLRKCLTILRLSCMVDLIFKKSFLKVILEITALYTRLFLKVMKKFVKKGEQSKMQISLIFL